MAVVQSEIGDGRAAPAGSSLDGHRRSTEPTVLVMGEDVEVREALVAILRENGFRVRAGSADVATLDEGGLDEVDVVIVDLDRRDVDFCRHLRLRTKLPIIVVNAVDSVERTTASLDLGADDVVSRSVSVPELLARTRVAVRHRRALATVIDDDLLQVGLLRMDLSSYQAMLVDHPLELTVKEFALLALLGRNPGKVVTYRVLLAHVWGADAGMDTLRTHVSHLRRKLACVDGGIEIIAEAGLGYRLETDPNATVAVSPPMTSETHQEFDISY